MNPSDLLWCWITQSAELPRKSCSSNTAGLHRPQEQQLARKPVAAGRPVEVVPGVLLAVFDPVQTEPVAVRRLGCEGLGRVAVAADHLHLPTHLALTTATVNSKLAGEPLAIVVQTFVT